MKNQYLNSLLFVYLLYSSIFSFEGDPAVCGERKAGKLLSALTTWVIPDQWPPNEIPTALLSAGGTSQLCRLVGTADWSPSCKTHDYCYGMASDTRINCDLQLAANWSKACGTVYKPLSPGLISGGVRDLSMGSVELVGNTLGCAVEVGELLIDGVSYVYSITSDGTMYLVKTTSAGVAYIEEKLSQLGGNFISAGEAIGDHVVSAARGLIRAGQNTGELVISGGNYIKDSSRRTIRKGKRFVKSIVGLGKTTALNSCVEIASDLKQVGEGAVKISVGVGNLPFDALRVECAIQCASDASIMAAIVHLFGGFMYGAHPDAQERPWNERLLKIAVEKAQPMIMAEMDLHGAENAQHYITPKLEKIYAESIASTLVPVHSLLLY